MPESMRKAMMFSVGWLLGQGPVTGESVAVAGKTFAKDIRPLMETYCWDCHGDGADKGEVNFDAFTDEASVLAARKLWQGTMFHIEQWTMPPADKKTQPTREERELLVAWIDQLLNPVDPANPDPGRVTVRRLNRVEYNNTVRDLLGVKSRPADEFPEDDTGYGFDNIGDVLTLPPILMERYLIAADRVLNEVLPPLPGPPDRREYSGEALHGAGLPDNETRLLAFPGECEVDFDAAADGSYRIRVVAWEEAAGNERAKLRVKAAGKEVGTFVMESADPEKPQTIEAKVTLARGSHKVTADFLNDFYDPSLPEGKGRDRNIRLRSIEVEGPLDVKPAPPSEVLGKVLAKAGAEGESEAGARLVLQHFASRAFRRAALPGEVDRLMKVFAAVSGAGEGWRDSLRVAMKAVLVSPHFLYRIERQPDAENPQKIVDVNEYALASRLSYWLWSSMPDDELLSLAFRNQLRSNLPAQIERMLADPKSRALAENFGGQWLELRSLGAARPDPERFPEFTPELRAAMRRETEELFAHIVRENRPVTEFLDAGYSYLNGTLAQFYGIEGVSGDDWRKVTLPESAQRRGILTHASILTVTSDSIRTSPVKRGKWLLENILGISAPPAPPNVPALAEGREVEKSGTVRQRLEAHRTKPGCAGCHSLIDPLGFALENYNAIGKWRDRDGEFPVDNSGVLTTGQKFSGAGDLAKIFLTERRDTFVRGVVRKMMTYALGRGVEPYDRPAVEAVMERMEREGYAMRSLILGIAESLPFQKRRGEGS